MNQSAALRNYLDTFLLDSRNGDRVPTSLALAQNFGIAQSTVKRVLREYMRAGRMHGVRGLGTFTGSTKVPMPAAPAHFTRNSASTFADLVIGQIRSGALKTHDPLPAVKFMVEQFHVSPRTVMNAYRELQARGEVTRAGKRFIAGSTRSVMVDIQRKPVLAILCKPLHENSVFGPGCLAQSFLRMEQELQEKGCRLYVHTRGNQHELSTLLKTLQPFSVLLYAPEDIGQVETTLMQVRDLAKHTLHPPTVLCVALTHVLSKIPGARRLQILNTGNIATVQCRSCAEFLVEQGYRSAMLWFDHDADEPQIHQYLKIYPELLRLDKEFSLRIAVDYQESGLDRFAAKVFAKNRMARLRQILCKYTPLECDELEYAVWGIRGFDTAFRSGTDRQAWLFASGRHALRCQQWSRDYRVSVPGNLAIIALDNRLECAEKGITVSIPDWNGIGHIMAQVLLGERVERSRKGFVRSRAITVERMTTPLQPKRSRADQPGGGGPTQQ